jgi:hypothetical protein
VLPTRCTLSIERVSDKAGHHQGENTCPQRNNSQRRTSM